MTTERDRPKFSSSRSHWITERNATSASLIVCLKKAHVRVLPQQLLHFYTAVIRPVLEHASPVWHYPSPELSLHLESIQKRAVHIIFSFTRGMSYPNVLFVANSLKDRRDKFSRTFFQNMCKPASCLHHLLPPPRNTSVISRLRSSTPLPRPTSRTKKVWIFCKFCTQ